MNQANRASDIDYWIRFSTGNIPFEKAILDFLCKKQDVQNLYVSGLSSEQQIAIATQLLHALLQLPLTDIPSLLKKANTTEPVLPSNVPQFSNFASALIYLPRVLCETGGCISHQEVGYLLHQNCTSDLAARKYGENHAKLAILCGLATPAKKDGFAGVQISLLGSAYCKLEQEEKLDVLAKLCYRIPIIQKAVLCADKTNSVEESLLTLSPTTRSRRRRNVYEILAFALNE